MIIVQLKGGLGNQLFQYAVGRRLAEKNNTQLQLDLTKFSHDTVRQHEFFGLDRYNIQSSPSPIFEVKQFYDNSLPGKLKRKAKQILGIGKIKRICEKEWYVFEPTVLNLPDNVFLWGYWQSEKYFHDIEDIIRKELTLKNALTPQSAIVEQQIKNTPNTVSLHIRRGDYITDTKTNSYLGVCSIDYYERCISILEKELGKLNIFIFSDDPDWVRKNLNSTNPFYFVEHNGIKNACEDMHLMSICEHNIIANSSFSWWGAWLNKNRNKKVFAPKLWIRNENHTKLDIVPDSWIRI